VTGRARDYAALAGLPHVRQLGSFGKPFGAKGKRFREESFLEASCAAVGMHGKLPPSRPRNPDACRGCKRFRVPPGLKGGDVHRTTRRVTMLREMKSIIGRLLPRSAEQFGRAPHAKLRPRHLSCEPLEHRQMLSVTAVDSALDYAIVDTGQTYCYDELGNVIDPAAGEAFFGQDAQQDGNQSSYTTNGDGLTVVDNVTGLTWTQSPDWDGDGDIDTNDKFTWGDAQSYVDTLNSQNYGGYSDWHLPDIKELYSLINFDGVTGMTVATSVPYIDGDYFAFGYGDEAAGERIIDAQYWSSTEYVSTTMNGDHTVFGVNFADGRIKGYGTVDPQTGGGKPQYVRYVRGNTDYGINDLVANGDGTVTDNATGLTWAQDDSGAGMDWEAALAWVQQMNDQNHLGHSDWRLPNAKELQSIVDYTRSPATTGSAAIDPVFNVSTITDDGGETDYPFFWTSTTHLDGPPELLGNYAVYVAFGEAEGWMQPPTGGEYRLLDVHGAGSQRSDPKSGNPDDYPNGNGPQGDVIRIYNYVRLVRDADASEPNVAPTAEAGGPYSGTQGAAITLSGVASSDTDGTIAAYAWDLDNDGQYDDATGVTASFAAATTGTFTVGLRVTDNDGATDTDTATVSVSALPNVAPTAEAGGPYSGTQGDSITLSGSASTDTDGTIAAYAWDLDNDGQYDDATGATAGFAATTTGTFTVGLRVTDNDGATDTDTATVTVSALPNAAPTADAGGPYSGTQGDTITLNGAASSDSDGTITAYAWDLDSDGQYDDASGATASFDATAAGTFTVGLQVTDNDGATDTDAAIITVSELSNASPWTHADVDDDASAFFDDSYVHELNITFDNEDWYSVLYNSHASDADDPYFEADFECDGIVMESVGVRFKGSSSFTIPGVKKSLKIDFDEYDEDNDELAFLGLKKLNLNNNYNDPTMMREKLFLDYASNFVEGVGRAVHTNVYINGEYWGLYTAVEQIDKTFVQSRFGSGEDGNLYKGAASDEAGDDPQADFGSDLTWLGSDVDPYDDYYQLKTNETAYDYSELVEFIDVLNNTPTEDLAASLEPLLDVDDALAGLAINNLFANLDSYSGAAHNYYLYDRDDTGQFTHILWDANESFGTFAQFTTPGQDMAELDPFWVPVAMGPPGQAAAEERPLMENLWAVDEYSEDYLRDLAEMLRGGFDVTSATERINELADLIRDDVIADPNKQYTSAQFETNLNDDIFDRGRTIYGLTSFIGDRAEYLSAELDTYATQSDLRLNELMSVNVATAQDESGDYDPWVEIYNFGSGLVDVSGLYLTDDAGDLTKWSMPSSNLDDGDFLTFWLDGETTEGINHANFSLSATGGTLHLSDGASLIDTVTYDAMADDLSLARVPDGDGEWESTDRPTPDAANLASIVSVQPVVLYVNEFMADNDTFIEDPDEAGAYEDWVELYNPGTESVDLSGMYMTDDLTDPVQWQFPAGMTIDAGGYLVVWADKDTDQGDAHAAFKLSTNGETIALYNTDGATLIDSIEFGVQTTDVSYGRYPDGTESWGSMATPTPGAANVNEIVGNIAPTADAGGPYAGQVGDTVALDASGSTDTDGTIAAYAWDLDNDGQYDDASGVTATFNAATAGTFTVGLQVTDDDGATSVDTATVTVTVDPVTPVVLYINEFMADNDTIIEDPDEAGAYEDWIELYNPGTEAIDLSGMYMTDDPTDPVQWQFPAGMTIDPGGYLVVWADKDTDQGDAHAAFKLSTDGETIALNNTDGATLIDSIEFGVQTTDVSYGRYPDGTESWGSMATPTPGAANVNETAVNVAPTAEAGGPYTGQVGNTVSLTAAGSSDPDGTIAAYAWDLDNDGQYDDATGVTATFDAATAGTFTVGLQVTDDDGATNVDTATVTVSEDANVAPTAHDGGPYNGETGDTLTLDASGSVDPDGTIVSYAWDLDNDGQHDDATGVTATYDATVAGTFAVSVMVTDDAGATSTDTAIVRISSSAVEPGSYVIVDTGQEDTYDDYGNVITEPEPGEAFYGQDGQYDGVEFAFEDNGDGTVADQNSGLTWQQTPSDVSMSYEEALEYANGAELGGYDDWRLPTAKELFSLSNFSEGWPYLDTEYFDLVGATDGAPPDGTEPPDAPPPEEDGDGTVSKDEQYWASYYVGTTHGDQESAFGVNAATGHIKAYPAEVSGQFGNYVRLVRGDIYGENSFVDNGDGTVTDLATGLMWQQADSGVGMDWEDALDYAEDLELAGYDDWFLPDIKQLQSILDYTQSPTAINETDIGPAIDTDYFDITQLPDGTTNTDSDYPYFWSSTSAYFGGDSPEHYYAWYASFGTAVDDNGDDSHGAGGVRFDTKVEGGPDGEGGERIYNFVRAVRYVGTDTEINEAPIAEAGEPYSGQVGDTINLDGSGSTDTDGTIALYEWDLDNDGQYDDATGATAGFTATTLGTFTVGLQVTDDDGATDTDTATVTVTVSPGGPTLLGPVEDMTLSGLDLSSGDLEYLVEPARDGYLTLLSAADGLQWQLFDPDTMSEIVPVHTGIEGRDDYVVAGTESYLLRLAGQATDFDLRLVNLVDESNETVNVYGTDGVDTFVIQCTTCEITINGVDYDFGESVVNSVQFDGAGGDDQAEITGTAHAERIDMSPGSGSLFGDAIEVNLVNTESIRVDGGGGVDEAFLVDSDGDDTVLADGLGMTMSGETLAGEAYANSVSNVTFSHAYATSGGFDRAELIGTAGRYDCFKGYIDPNDPNGQFGKLWTNGTQLRAKFFDDIVARGNEGDGDKAVFVSTTGSDRFEAGPDVATLTNSYVQYVANDFADIRAYAAGGGDDTLVLTESEGDDKMWLLSHKAVASGADYRVLARSFDHIVAEAAVFDGDRDEVRLYDSPTDDTLTVTLDEAQMTGGVDFTATGFRKVKAYSLYAGDTDVATIAGGTGDDSLTARSDSNGVLSVSDYVDLLASTPEGIALLRAVAFSDVTVDSGDGDDTANTPDDLSALDYVLRMEGQWDE
jgi:spore coat protein CotH